jgi:hypothetical protein
MDLAGYNSKSHWCNPFKATASVAQQGKADFTKLNGNPEGNHDFGTNR